MDAPLDNRKALITIFLLQYDNYDFILNFSTIYQFTILPLPRAQGSCYPGLPLELKILQYDFIWVVIDKLTKSAHFFYPLKLTILWRD